MGFIFTFVLLTGVFALLILAVPIALLIIGFEIAFDFVSEHYISIIVVAICVSVLLNLIPVRRINNGFLTYSGQVLSARNYLEFILGLSIISLIALFIAQLF